MASGCAASGRAEVGAPGSRPADRRTHSSPPSKRHPFRAIPAGVGGQIHEVQVANPSASATVAFSGWLLAHVSASDRL